MVSAQEITVSYRVFFVGKRTEILWRSAVVPEDTTGQGAQPPVSGNGPRLKQPT